MEIATRLFSRQPWVDPMTETDRRGRHLPNERTSCRLDDRTREFEAQGDVTPLLMTEIRQDRNGIQTEPISAEIEMDVIKTRFVSDYYNIFDTSSSLQHRRS
jgi:hypothetical protein